MAPILSILGEPGRRVRHDRLYERGKDLYSVRAIDTDCGGAGVETRPAIIL